MASSCVACCIFHIISIPFNCSDTALRVKLCKARKLNFFVFRDAFVSALFLELVPRIFGLNFLISEAGLKFLIWTHGELIRPGNWASRVNRTHVRERTEPARPFIATHRNFYKGFRGKARSRKPGQPGQLSSCEEDLLLHSCCSVCNVNLEVMGLDRVEILRVFFFNPQISRAEHMTDWQYLSLGCIEQNEFFPKSKSWRLLIVP